MTTTTISSATTSRITLAPGDTLSVPSPTGSIITSSTSNATVTWALSNTAGTTTITNAGTLSNLGGSGAIAIGLTGTTTALETLNISNTGTISAYDAIKFAAGIPNGTIALTNSGVITGQTAKAFNLQEYQNLSSYSVTNQATGAITGVTDGLKIGTKQSTAPTFTGTITVDNYNSIKTTGTAGNAGEAIDFAAITASTGTITVTNRATGVLESADSDGVRGAAGMTLNNYGSITGKTAGSSGNDGVDFQGNAGGTINNYQGASITGARHGITNKTPITITNDGSITGQLGSGINLDTASTTTTTITNQSHGVITGNASGSTDGDGIDVDGLVAITNSGDIEAAGIATSFVAPDTSAPLNEAITIGGGTITNNAGGIIHSVQRAITVDDSAGGNAFGKTTITNHGTITGDNGEAISIHSAFDDVITNDGTITGSVSITSVTASNGNASITNSGTITGTVTTGGGNDTIDDTGSITGAITMGGGGDALTLGSVHVAAVDLGAGTDTISVKASAHAYLDGAVSGAETIALGANATLDIALGIGSAAVQFADASAQKLVLAAGAFSSGDFANTITGLGAGDSIDVKGFGLATSATLGAGNVLTLSGGTSSVTLHLDPAQDFSAQRFHLSSDGAGGTLVTLFDNSAPVSAISNASGTEDTLLTGTVSASDADNDSLSYSLGTGPAHGGLVFHSDGSWSYTPDQDYNGSDSFTWTVSDGTASSATAGTVSISLAAVNDAPALTGTQATLAHATEDADHTVTKAQLLQGFTDVDGNTLSVSALSVDHGTASQNPDGSWTVSLDSNYNGALALSYTVIDGNGGSVAGSLTTTVDAVNDAPALTGAKATLAHATEDTDYTVTKAQLLQGFTDVEGDTLSVGSLSVNHGTATENPDGSWTVSLDANYNGALAVSYTVVDGNGGSASGSLTTTVDAVNDAPALTGSKADLANGTEDFIYTVTKAQLLQGFTDVDGDTLSIGSLSVNHGSASENLDGSWTVSLPANYNGALAFTYAVIDGKGGSVAASLSTTVDADNDAPALTGTKATLANGTEDTAYTVTKAQLLQGFTDVDGDTLSVGSLSVDQGTASQNPDGSWTVTLPANYNGALAFSYSVVDGKGGSVPGSLTATVAAVNDAPVIDSNLGGATAAISLAENTAAVTTVHAVDPDTGTTLAYSVSGTDAALFAIDATSGALTFKVAPNFEAPTDAGANNVYNVVVTASDGTLSDTQALTITVTDVLEATNPVGTAGNDAIVGTSGADSLFGLAGDDTLLGLGGNDLLDGGQGKDKMTGGLGDDTYVVDSSGDKVIELVGEGTDTVQTGLAKYLLGANVENLTFTDGGAHTGIGNDLANRLVGGAGVDVLNGKGGADVLQGGLGNDIYYVDNAGDSVIEAVGGGFDTVLATTSFALAAGAEIEVLTLKSGADALNLTGSNTDNVLTGNSLANVLAGLGGNDTLIGGKGKDFLTGGAGADRFVFDTKPNVTSNLDTVTDFVSGTDKLVFDQSVFKGFAATGAISAAAFWSGAGVTAAHDADDRLIYNTSNGALYYDADGTGSTKAVQVAVLSGNPALVFGDFLIVA